MKYSSSFAVSEEFNSDFPGSTQPDSEYIGHLKRACGQQLGVAMAKNIGFTETQTEGKTLYTCELEAFPVAEFEAFLKELHHACLVALEGENQSDRIRRIIHKLLKT